MKTRLLGGFVGLVIAALSISFAHAATFDEGAQAVIEQAQLTVFDVEKVADTICVIQTETNQAVGPRVELASVTNQSLSTEFTVLNRSFNQYQAVNEVGWRI